MKSLSSGAVEGERNNAPLLQNGESVVMTTGGAVSNCMVFQSSASGAILVPTQTTPGFQSLLTKLPLKGQIQLASSAEYNIQINESGAVLALSVSIGSGYPSNKRRWFRVHINFDVKISTNGLTWYDMQGENISEGGLLVKNREALAITMGQLVLARIHLPGMAPITANGIVRRLSFPNGNPTVPVIVALQFTSLGVDDQRRLALFIHQYQKEQMIHVRAE